MLLSCCSVFLPFQALDLSSLTAQGEAAGALDVMEIYPWVRKTLL